MLYNLVRETTATAGTGTITLGGAVSGCLSFSGASVPDGAVVSYGISDGNNSEVGRGTYDSDTGTLTRDTVLASTNSGSKINLSGNAQVYICALAEDILDEFDIPVIIGNGVEVPSTGVQGVGIHIPCKCEVISWDMVSDASGSAVIDIWKDTYANYPPTVGDTIITSGKPTLSSAQTAQGSPTISTWPGKVLEKDSYLLLNLDSVSTCKMINLTLKCKRLIK